MLPSSRARSQRCTRLRLRGLMTIPPATRSDPAHWFRELAALRDATRAPTALDVDTLSMGMSADFEQAIAAGVDLRADRDCDLRRSRLTESSCSAPAAPCYGAAIDRQGGLRASRHTMQMSLLFHRRRRCRRSLHARLFVLRFILQWMRASYYRARSRSSCCRLRRRSSCPRDACYRACAALDLPTLVVIFALECVVDVAATTRSSASVPSFEMFLAAVLLRLVTLTLWFYCTVALFIYVVMSWLGDRDAQPERRDCSASSSTRCCVPFAQGYAADRGPRPVGPVIVLILLPGRMIASPLPRCLARQRTVRARNVDRSCERPIAWAASRFGTNAVE